MSALKQVLRDGFEEIFTFEGHRLNIRGFNMVEISEETKIQSELTIKQQYLSWDMKQILLWESNFTYCKPATLQTMRFNQPNFICSVIHIPKLRVFLAAALDMSFKIYDKHLRLLESIHHEERAILQLEYDPVKDIILSSGASGVSLWKIYRSTTIDIVHVMEKLHGFEGCTEWVTKMVYDSKYNKIYAIQDRSAQILCLHKRAVINELKNVHECPLNVVCWYERNQFFITGCSRGEIKCWSSNYANADCVARQQLAAAQYSSNNSTSGNSNPGYTPTKSSSSNHTRAFAMLHAFKGHTKAVTGLMLHPVSGLAISTSMDGFVKILNLEAMNELYCVNVGAGILELKLIPLGGGPGNSGIMFTMADSTVRLWKITSCCDFFSVCSSKVGRVSVFENLQVDNVFQFASQQLLERQQRLMAPTDIGSTTEGLTQLTAKLHFNSPLFSVNDPNILIDADDVSVSGDAEGGNSTNDKGSHSTAGRTRDRANSNITGGDAASTVRGNSVGGGNDSSHLLNKLLGSRANTSDHHHNDDDKDGDDDGDDDDVDDDSEDDEEKESNAQTALARSIAAAAIAGAEERVVIAYSTQDLRAFNQKGALLGRFEPEHVVDGVRAYTVSVYQKLLFLLTESDVVRVHDLKRYTCPVLKEHSIRGNTMEDNSLGLGTSCVMIDCIPNQAMRGNQASYNNKNSNNNNINNNVSGNGRQKQQQHSKRDARGVKVVANNIEEFLLIGLRNGAILFMDTLTNCEVAVNVQAHNGIITDLKYSRPHKELYVLGTDFSEICSTVRIWQLPAMDLKHEVTNLMHVSCLEITPTLKMFAVGSTSGLIRLYASSVEAVKPRLSVAVPADEDAGTADPPLPPISPKGEQGPTQRAHYMHSPKAKRTPAVGEAVEMKTKFREIVRHGQHHDEVVTSLCFNDVIRVFFSCSMDSTVKVWDFEKRLVRTIALNHPSASVICTNALSGDVTITQGLYLLTIPMTYWDEGGALHFVRNENETWDTKSSKARQEQEQQQKEQEQQQQRLKSPRSPHGERRTSNASIGSRARSSSSGRGRTESIGTDGGSVDSGTVDGDGTHTTGGKRRISKTHLLHSTLLQSTPNMSPDQRKHRKSISFGPHGGANIAGKVTGGGGPTLARFSKLVMQNPIDVGPHASQNNVSGADGGEQTISHVNGKTFVAQRKRGFSIDEIENELLPKLQLQYIRSLNAANVLNSIATAGIATTATAAINDASVFTATNDNDNDMPAPHSHSATAPTIAGNIINRGNDSAIDVLHPRFLIRKKPVAKTFRFEDLNLSQPQRASKHTTTTASGNSSPNHSPSHRMHALAQAQKETDAVKSFADPNHFLAQSIATFTSRSSAAVSDAKLRHRYSVSIATTPQQMHVSDDTGGAVAMASGQQPLASSFDNDSPMQRRTAQIGLSPRAQLTLLNSNETGVSAYAREQQEQIIYATLGMRVSEHYKKHPESIQIKNEEEFQEALRLYGVAPTEPEGSRGSSVNTSPRKNHRTVQAHVLGIRNSNAVSSTNSSFADDGGDIAAAGQGLNSPQGNVEGEKFAVPSPPPAAGSPSQSSPKTSNNKGGGGTVRPRQTSSTGGVLDMDVFARIVEKKVREEAEAERKREEQAAVKAAKKKQNMKTIVQTAFELNKAQNMSGSDTQTPPIAQSLAAQRAQRAQVMMARVPVSQLTDESNGNIGRSRRLEKNS